MASRRSVVSWLAVLAVLSSTEAARAQNWSFDARSVALGGVGSTGNLATKMIDEQRNYTAIVLPFGLFQVLSNTKRFDPNSKDFDPVLDIEYAASPFHWIIGRSKGNSGQTAFVNDIRNATLSRDLTKYKGFVPANDLLAEGLAGQTVGGTIKVRKSDRGGFQGIYIGGGPYLSMRTAATIDPGLTNVLASGINIRNAQFPIASTNEGQLALAVAGGYRGRFPWPAGVGSGSDREGLYVAVSLDLAVFGTNANIERKRQAAIAASIRFNHFK